MVRAYRSAKPMAYLFATLENLVRLLLEARRTTPMVEAVGPPPIMEPDDAWRTVLDDAREVLTAENYAMWFAKTRVQDAGHRAGGRPAVGRSADRVA